MLKELSGHSSIENGSMMRICVILVMAKTPIMKLGLISMEVDSIKLRELF
jgi:hypothetical protein